MTKPEDVNEQLIETIDEEGNVINFELLDIIEKDGKEYALLLPVTEEEEEEQEVVLMSLKKDGEEYVFEAIEDDDEFNAVVEYIDTLQDEDEDEEEEE